MPFNISHSFALINICAMQQSIFRLLILLLTVDTQPTALKRKIYAKMFVQLRWQTTIGYTHLLIFIRDLYILIWSIEHRTYRSGGALSFSFHFTSVPHSHFRWWWKCKQWSRLHYNMGERGDLFSDQIFVQLPFPIEQKSRPTYEIWTCNRKP